MSKYRKRIRGTNCIVNVTIIDFKDKLDNSNEKIKEGIEHIEQADSNIIKLNNRFLKYLGTSSPCRLLIFFIVEIVIAVALIIVFTKVGN